MLWKRSPKPPALVPPDMNPSNGGAPNRVGRCRLLEQRHCNQLALLRQGFVSGAESDKVSLLHPHNPADSLSMFGPRETALWKATHQISGEAVAGDLV